MSLEYWIDILSDFKLEISLKILQCCVAVPLSGNLLKMKPVQQGFTDRP